MFKFYNMKKIFIVVFLIGVVPALCMADGKKPRGTRVNAGAHADAPNGAALRLIVQYSNPSSDPITVKEIRVFRPDGTQASPNFAADSFPTPPFVLGPFQSKGFALFATGVQPVTFVPRGVFQVHTDWESKRATNGLRSFSVVVSISPGGAVVSKIGVEGFDLPGGKRKKEDD